VQALRKRLAAQGGFTMIVAMGVLLVVMGLSVAAFAAAGGDIRIGGLNRDQKEAQSAAEAGLAWYQSQLNQDTSYWANCTNVPAPADVPAAPVNNPWNGTGADPRQWRNVPDSAAQYTIELLPAPGQTACDPNNPETTMIDPSSGTFRIRVTGCARSCSTATRGKRSIVATFRRKGFLDYLYFTDLETSDPTWVPKLYNPNGYPTRGPPPTNDPNDTLDNWAASACSQYYRDTRKNAQYDGYINSGSGWTRFAVGCAEIQFADQDAINGPFHTNDSIMVCGHPDFGRNANDKVEVTDSTSTAWRSACFGANPFPMKGTWTPGADKLDLPPSNTKLKKAASSTYTFTGKTTIVFQSSGNMLVTNSAAGLSSSPMALPSNGVIYVQNGSCGVGYDPINPDSDPSGCGDAIVSGTYMGNVTVGAEQDIVVANNLVKGGDYLMGLIANNFIRVYHPANYGSGNGSPACSNNGSPTNVNIDASILSLQHSFLVDRYFCGSSLGTLTVTGSIGQKYRGPVGTSGGTGYIKSYNYDDRLKYRAPPKFLDPVQAAWGIVRKVEQSPAR
jgi:hypothetical protein